MTQTLLPRTALKTNNRNVNKDGGAELQTGDDLLFLVARCDFGPPPDFACLNPPVLPLGLSGPSTAAPGAPFSVSVIEFAGAGTRSPAAGRQRAADAAGDEAGPCAHDAAERLRDDRLRRALRDRTPRRAKCGAANGFWFGVGDRKDTSYLLPRALPRGHYVLHVNVIDKAFNRDDPRRRGANRIVFDVR